jgi:hypothetical protein
MTTKEATILGMSIHNSVSFVNCIIERNGSLSTHKSTNTVDERRIRMKLWSGCSEKIKNV